MEMHHDMQKASASSKTALLQQLSDEWLQIGQPVIAADYLRQKAESEPTYENFMRAGSALSSLIDFVEEEDLRVSVVYGARFCFEEAGRPDEGFQFRGIGRSVIARLLIATEQIRGDLIHPLIGALRRQDRGDQ